MSINTDSLSSAMEQGGREPQVWEHRDMVPPQLHQGPQSGQGAYFGEPIAWLFFANFWPKTGSAQGMHTIFHSYISEVICWQHKEMR